MEFKIQTHFKEHIIHIIRADTVFSCTWSTDRRMERITYEEHHNLYLLRITMIIEGRKMKWVEHAAYMEANISFSQKP
jgi:hypothetical protein